MSTPTRTEVETAIAAAEEAWPQIVGWPDQTWMVAALCAVLPDHDAAVRADERARIAEEIRSTMVAGVKMPEDLRPAAGRSTVAAYAEWAARIAEARAGRT